MRYRRFTEYAGFFVGFNCFISDSEDASAFDDIHEKTEGCLVRSHFLSGFETHERNSHLGFVGKQLSSCFIGVEFFQLLKIKYFHFVILTSLVLIIVQERLGRHDQDHACPTMWNQSARCMNIHGSAILKPETDMNKPPFAIPPFILLIFAFPLVRGDPAKQVLRCADQKDSFGQGDVACRKQAGGQAGYHLDPDMPVHGRFGALNFHELEGPSGRLCFPGARKFSGDPFYQEVLTDVLLLSLSSTQDEKDRNGL